MKFELAQLNIANLVAPLDSVELADFVANLENVNKLADHAPGFVWRLQTEEGDATSIKDFGNEFVVNMSVWKDLISLHDFVYRSGHIKVMSRRKEWFNRMENAYSVLWWVRVGHRPSVSEARNKLQLLRSRGSSKAAFTFKDTYPAPATKKQEFLFDDPCPAT